MKRTALASFLRSLVLTTAAGCCSDLRETVRERVDAFDVGDAGVQVGEALPAPSCASVCQAPPRSSLKEVYGCAVAATADGGITAVDCDEKVERCSSIVCCGGRPPLGLRARAAIAPRDEVGAFFAGMAHGETAAVAGFEELAVALAAHGAPQRLVDDARRAAADERRHARVATLFARRRGVMPPPVEIDAVDAPSLEALAVANAAEGCVVETFGAVVTAWQARHAADPVVRRAFANIARDELRHAELAFALGRWLQSRLRPAARRSVADAQRDAADRLTSDVERATSARLVAEVGLPEVDTARNLVVRMRAELWPTRKAA